MSLRSARPKKRAFDVRKGHQNASSLRNQRVRRKREALGVRDVEIIPTRGCAVDENARPVMHCSVFHMDVAGYVSFPPMFLSDHTAGRSCSWILYSTRTEQVACSSNIFRDNATRWSKAANYGPVTSAHLLKEKVALCLSPVVNIFSAVCGETRPPATIR